MGYIYDPLIADKILVLLSQNDNINSYKLIEKVSELVKENFERMRKRKEDTNKFYTPGRPKITKNIKILKDWRLIKKETKEEGKQRIFYSLTDIGRYILDRGIKPEASYRLRDAYQMLLRMAAEGTHVPHFSEKIDIPYQLGYDRVAKKERPYETIITEGASIEDILNKKDSLENANFNHNNFTSEELEEVFKNAEAEGTVTKKWIDGEIRYVINPVLKQFVQDCWVWFNAATEQLIEYTIITQKLKIKDKEEIEKWLKFRYGEVNADERLKKYTKNERDYYNSTKRKYQLIRSNRRLFHKSENSGSDRLIFDELVKEKREDLEKKMNDEQKINFKPVIEALLDYTAPDHIKRIIGKYYEEGTIKCGRKVVSRERFEEVLNFEEIQPQEYFDLDKVKHDKYYEFGSVKHELNDKYYLEFEREEGTYTRKREHDSLLSLIEELNNLKNVDYITKIRWRNTTKNTEWIEEEPTARNTFLNMDEKERREIEEEKLRKQRMVKTDAELKAYYNYEGIQHGPNDKYEVRFFGQYSGYDPEIFTYTRFRRRINQLNTNELVDTIEWRNISKKTGWIKIKSKEFLSTPK